jgi:hypothetical protein
MVTADGENIMLPLGPTVTAADPLGVTEVGAAFPLSSLPPHPNREIQTIARVLFMDVLLEARRERRRGGVTLKRSAPNSGVSNLETPATGAGFRGRVRRHCARRLQE